MKGLKFIETLKVTFEKPAADEELIVKTAYFNSQAQTISNLTQIELSLQLSKEQILNKISKWISEGSGWTVKSIVIVKYQPMKGSSHIKLPKELQHSAKGLINVQSNDNQCFGWCNIRHLNQKNTNPQRIKKVDKEFITNLDHKDIEFPVTIKQIHKIEKQNSININVLGCEEKQPYPFKSEM